MPFLWAKVLIFQGSAHQNGVGSLSYQIKNGGNFMPYNGKEYDGYLFDQLTILERLERIAKKSDNKEIMEEINIIRKEIERKLYRPGSKSE